MNTRTLFELMRDYLEHARALQMSPRTLRSCAFRLRAFLRWLQRTFQVHTPDQVQPRHFELWQRHLHTWRTTKGYPLKPGSINRRIGNVRGFFKYLVSRGYVQQRLVETCCYVREPKLLPVSVLTHAQVKKILRRIDTSTCTGQRDRTMLELLYSTGMRVGELLGLDVDAFDTGTGTLRVMGKGRKERVVPIGKTAVRYLESYLVGMRSYLAREANEQALFLDRHGHRMPYHIFLGNVHRYADPLGLEFSITPHTFRRSCTTELIRGGANMYHVKELLGHESLDTLKHYARLTILDLKKTHQKCHPREKDDRSQ